MASKRANGRSVGGGFKKPDGSYDFEPIFKNLHWRVKAEAARRVLREQGKVKPRIKPEDRTPSTKKKKKKGPSQTKPRKGWEGYTGRSRWW